MLSFAEDRIKNGSLRSQTAIFYWAPIKINTCSGRYIDSIRLQVYGKKMPVLLGPNWLHGPYTARLADERAVAAEIFGREPA